MDLENYYTEPLPLETEINAWVELLIDHARFMRNGFNTTEEMLFREADQFSRQFEQLSCRELGQPDLDRWYLSELQRLVCDFINFKARVAGGIENCRILSILPAALIDHIRREAIFFSGILARVQREPRPTWRQLGLPDSRIAATSPQAYIPRLSGELEQITWEELLFFLTINYEHAEVLSLYFRPMQGEIREQTLEWGRRVRRVYDEVLQAYEMGGDNPRRFITPAMQVVSGWVDFLQNLYNMLANCTIPGSQMNIWPRVVDHMIREGIYFLQVLAIIQGLTC